MSDLVQRLRNRIHDSNMPTERLLDDAAEALEAKDKEIALLNVRLDSNLKQIVESMSNEKYQLTIERDKYKALCDQMGEALEVSPSQFPCHHRQVKEALAAWRHSNEPAM